MRVMSVLQVTALLVAAAMLLAAQAGNPAPTAGQMPPGHGIKCLKADEKTPCGSSEISDLSNDIKDLKATFGDAKSTVSDAQQNVSDAKQVAGDAKQIGSDARHPAANSKQDVSDAKQAGSDAKSAYDDAQQTKSDTQQTVQDVQQNVQDAAQTVKGLKGIGSLALKALDGTMSCAQNDGSACTDSQTKALQVHAAQKNPPVNVKREVDQGGK